MSDIQLQSITNQYKEMGLQWLKGEVELSEWKIGDKHLILNPTQKQFVNDKTREVMGYGGYGSGKTVALIIKMIMLCLFFPNNRILLGRKTRTLIEKTTLNDFYDLCSPSLYKFKSLPGIIEFFNGSEIILFGLDTLQAGTQQDIKKAEQEIKGLNLGGVFIDQMEEVESNVYEALKNRVRREVVPFRQMANTSNPALYWADGYFLKQKADTRKVYRFSTEENKHNLPEDTVKDFESRSDAYKKIYYHGFWELDVTAGQNVFSQEYQHDQEFNVRDPIRSFDGIQIWQEPREGMTYTVGVDPSDGATDPCGISVVCRQTGEQVAKFNAKVPISVVADKSILLASMYSPSKPAFIIPESTGAGLALIENLKVRWNHIYHTERRGNDTDKETDKLGFPTTHQSKKELINNFELLLRNKYVRIRDRETIEEMKVFIYSNTVKKKGAGAADGYHDDNLFSMMLACWNLEKNIKKDQSIFDSFLKSKSKIDYKYI